MEPATGHVTLTVDDLAAGVRAMPEQRRARWSVLIAPAALVGIVTLPSSPLRGGDTGLMVFLPLAVLGFLAFRLISLPRHIAQRQFEAMKPDEREMAYELADARVVIQSGSGKAELDYSAIHRVVEGPESFLLYTSPTIAQIIPKRAFAQADLETIRTLLGEHVEPRSQPSGLKRTLLLWVVLVVTFLVVWSITTPR